MKFSPLKTNDNFIIDGHHRLECVEKSLNITLFTDCLHPSVKLKVY